jgi:hypothetical protein
VVVGKQFTKRKFAPTHQNVDAARSFQRDGLVGLKSTKVVDRERMVLDDVVFYP